MADESAHARLAAAYERLRAEVLARAGSVDLPADSLTLAVLLKSLDRLRDQIDHDPTWLDSVAKELHLSTRDAPDDSSST